MRLIVTDASGWRIAIKRRRVLRNRQEPTGVGSFWLRFTYDALVDSGEAAELAKPDPSGREQQRLHCSQALAGQNSAVSWFRSADSGRAVVAVAQPIIADGETIGAVVFCSRAQMPS